MLSIHSALDCVCHLLDTIFYLWLQIFQLTGPSSHFVESLYFVCVSELFRKRWSFINKALVFIRVFQSGAICSLVFREEELDRGDIAQFQLVKTRLLFVLYDLLLQLRVKIAQRVETGVEFAAGFIRQLKYALGGFLNSASLLSEGGCRLGVSLRVEADLVCRHWERMQVLAT